MSPVPDYVTRAVRRLHPATATDPSQNGAVIRTPLLDDSSPLKECRHGDCAAAEMSQGVCVAHLDAAKLAAHMRVLASTRGARRATITPERLSLVLKGLVAGDPEAPGVSGGDDRSAHFRGEALFDGARFVGRPVFRGVTFDALAAFDGAAFINGAEFIDVNFESHADFDGACFEQDANFARVVFSDHAGFERGVFRSAKFVRTAFRDTIDLTNTRFESKVEFLNCSFERAREFGPICADQHLSIDGCVFAMRIDFETSAQTFSAQGTTFAGGANLRLTRAEIALDGASFAQASSLTGIRGSDSDVLPRLLTVRGAEVSALSLASLDMSACRFYGAHGLSSLSIEPSCVWPRSPDHRRIVDRETLAEEHLFRGETWLDRKILPPDWLKRRAFTPDGRDPPDGPDLLRADQVAGLYRALRKAREDSRDPAGAADLYYGEMEMRRRVPLESIGRRGWVRTRVDKAILTAYWLTSGYGLRASRAVLCLLVLVVAASVALSAWGFDPSAPRARALLFAVESTSSLFRTPVTRGYDLTYTGESIQVLLRLLGPLLLGLSLLAIRARIKR
jgi:hypothetical protein